MKGGKHRNGHAMTSVYRYDPVAREMTCDFGGVTNVYRYDVDGRLTAVSVPGEGWASYSYNAKGQNDAITLPGGTRRMLSYDAFGRLSGQSVQDSGGNALLSQAYQRSLTGRLETKTTDAGTWKYGYDLTDQVTNAVLSASASTDGAWGYQYDPMGNRKAVSELSASGGTSELSVYSANSLNQYTTISNQQSAISHPTYDLNGNMTWDGTNAYFWDVQNQLVLVSNVQFQVSNAYDAMGRRVRKEVSAYNSSTSNYEPVTTNFFFYDGWNMVRETVQLNAPTPPNALTNCYTWGNDLSGSLQGAGGVGGLLAVTTPNSQTPTPSNPQTFYPLYDHNGNVERYIARNGATVAAFQYDAFGNTISETLSNFSTSELSNFPFRFSTKYWDVETGLVMFQLRPYSPALGRWICRDKFGELGGVGLLAMLRNDLINDVDHLGLMSMHVWGKPSDRQKHFNDLERQLRKRLEDLCPKEAVCLKSKDGKTYLYTHEDCMRAAADFAFAYVNAAYLVYSEDKDDNGSAWGGSPGNMFSEWLKYGPSFVLPNLFTGSDIVFGIITRILNISLTLPTI